MSNLEQLFGVLRSLKMDYGVDFFSSLTLQLHQIIGADYTFIAKIDSDVMVSKTIAFATKDGLQENFEYALEHTPCHDVSHDTVCVYPSQICNIYPQDQLLIDMNINGYVGVPLHSSTGQVVGLVVGLFEKSIENSESVANAFQFFEGRISAELERTNIVQELQKMNDELEQLVDERTKKLKNALLSLEQTQQQMIEQEKQASLGRLVVGVAHEINTPLGVSILAGTTLSETINGLNTVIEAKQLTKPKLVKYCSEIEEAASIINFNLSRAAELVTNFKQISSDQINDEVVSLELNDWLAKVVSSLNPLARQHDVSLQKVTTQTSCVCTTYPAKLYQVINNVISNAVKHAFDKAENNQEPCCTVTCEYNDAETLQLTISDNGRGIDQETLTHIYEPFYTTKRGQGGTGLGMSIVYSLVTGPLCGKVSIETKPSTGTSVIITLPLSVKPHLKD